MPPTLKLYAKSTENRLILQYTKPIYDIQNINAQKKALETYGLAGERYKIPEYDRKIRKGRDVTKYSNRKYAKRPWTGKKGYSRPKEAMGNPQEKLLDR